MFTTDLDEESLSRDVLENKKKPQLSRKNCYDKQTRRLQKKKKYIKNNNTRRIYTRSELNC